VTTTVTRPKSDRPKWVREVALDVACLSPLVVWWLAALPGYFSPDSLDVLQQVRSGEWTNVHTTMFTTWAYITTLHGSIPSLLTLAQAILLGLALLTLARAIFPVQHHDALRRSVLVAFAVSPSFGGLSIMAWKDVPYAAGALVVAAALLHISRTPNQVSGHPRVTAILLVVGGILLSGFRWNGAVTVVLIAAAFAMVVRPIRRTALVLLIVVGGVGASSLIVPERVGLVEGPTWLQLNSRRLHDIAVGISDGSFVPDPDQSRRLKSVMPISNWKIAGNDCSTHDEMMFSEFSRLEDEQREHLRQVLPMWDAFADNAPLTVVKSRACKLLPSLFPVQLGPTRPLALWSRPNLDPELAQPRHLGVISDVVEGVADRSNTAPWLNWSLFRTPVWLMLNLVALGWLVMQRRLRREHILITVIAVGVQLSAGLVAYAQDYRYTAGALFLLQLNLVKMIRDGMATAINPESTNTY